MDNQPSAEHLVMCAAPAETRRQHTVRVTAGFGNLGTLVFAIAFTGGILAQTTRDVWRVVGWLMLDGAAASATIAFVGFWVLATSAREVSHSAWSAAPRAPPNSMGCLHRNRVDGQHFWHDLTASIHLCVIGAHCPRLARHEQ